MLSYFQNVFQNICFSFSMFWHLFLADLAALWLKINNFFFLIESGKCDFQFTDQCSHNLNLYWFIFLKIHIICGNLHQPSVPLCSHKLFIYWDLLIFRLSIRDTCIDTEKNIMRVCKPHHTQWSQDVNPHVRRSEAEGLLAGPERQSNIIWVWNPVMRWNISRPVYLK